MHLRNTDSAAITPATPPADPCTKMHDNAPKCTINREIDLPILIPQHPLPPPTSPPPHFPTSVTDPLTLTPKQHTAVSLLCTGMNLDLVAARLKIDRSTLYRWRHHHPAFIAELARRQREAHDAIARRLRLHLQDALECVADHVATARYREDRVKTALALLRHANLKSLVSTGTDEPATPTRALDHLIRQDWQSRNLPPERQIDDYDREQFLSDLQQLESAHPLPQPPPTHTRLAGTPKTSPEPYPTPDNAPPATTDQPTADHGPRTNSTAP